MISYWLSFCDPGRPKGTQFLGAAIVPIVDRPRNPSTEEPALVVAVMTAHRLRCNPGGEVAGHAIPPDIDARVPERYRGRLLTRAECDALARFMAETVS